MIPKSLSKISLVSSGNVLNAILGFTFLSAVAKNLTVEEFGRYALLTSLLVSISKIIDFGTNSTFVAQSISTNKDLNSTFLTVKVILFLITIPISFIALILLNLWNFSSVLIFLFGLVFYGINITLFAFFQRKEQFLSAVLLNTIPAIIKGIIAALLFTTQTQINYIYAFFVFSFSMASSVLLAFGLKDEFRNIKISDLLIRKMFAISSYAGISQVITNGWPAIANSIAKLARSFSDVGIFSLADKVANIFYLISLSIFTVLLPKNALRKKNNERFDLKESLFFSTGILGLSAVSMVFAGVFLSKSFGDKYSNSVGLVNILIIASAFTAIHVFLENFFYVEQKTKSLFFITISKLVLFIALSLILLPVLSVKGIAYAQLISSIYALIFTLFLIRFNSR